jgi:predicted nucleotidyltransferase
MPSAYELGPEGWQKYKCKNNRAKTPSLSIEEQKSILQKISKAAHFLKKDFGATRVLIFGSLLYRDQYTNQSDIDIAVDGIRHEDYWKAWRSVEHFLPDQLVDFIDINDLEESFRLNIIKKGVSV